jgi:hypothetical protein
MTAFFGNEILLDAMKSRLAKKDKEQEVSKQVTARFGVNLRNTEPSKPVKCDEILYDTVAKKKSRMFFYTSRRVVIHMDGSFCYYKNGSKVIKRSFLPSQVSRVERSKNLLTIFT